MKAHHLSASKVDLALHCLYWARGDVQHPRRAPGQAAARGIAVHKASENYHLKKPLPELDSDATAMWLTLRNWLASNEQATHVELPILYDAENDTATVCEMGADERAYLNVTPMTIPMRLDLVWAPSTHGEPIVIDIKTGSRSNAATPAENFQLATQAVGYSRLLRWAGSMTVGLLFPMKTKTHDDRHTLDADALDAHAGLLHRRLRMIPDAQPEKGQHCWKCPVGPTRDHQATCPAWAKEEACSQSPSPEI